MDEKEDVKGMAEADPLPARIFAAYNAYRRVEEELFYAVSAIVGEHRLEDAHVEYDSEYDNSVEICLAGGAKLTDDERVAIKALGFSRVWNDERSGRDGAEPIRKLASSAAGKAVDACAALADEWSLDLFKDAIKSAKARIVKEATGGDHV